MVKTREYVRGLIGALRDLNNNQPPLFGVYPDYMAPVVRMQDDQRVLQNARWGLPTPVRALGNRKSDPGVTNVRNTFSGYWKRWLERPNRCLVPFTSFAEPEYVNGKAQNAWFAFDETRTINFFAGIWIPQWKSVRRVKEGETVNDLFAFLTCDPNADVRPLHEKAMPVILTKPDEWETWLTADWSEARALQRPLPDGSLKVVARGGKQDGGSSGELGPEPTFL